MPDDRKPLGEVAYEKWLDWVLEQPETWPMVAWDLLGTKKREPYERMASAVAAQAVRDAGLECERMKAQLFAIGATMPAVRRALVIAITESAYEAEAKDYRAALKVYGAGEDQERSEEKGADHA